MEATAPKTPPEPPVRVLVQTLTHLVPRTEDSDRSSFMPSLICQHHWNCDFEAPEFRRASYNELFGFDNRRCFFLVYYGESNNDGDVPVLSYEWTGDSLKPLPQLLKDPEIQTYLKHEIPFTRKPREREKRPVREIVKSRLYCDADIPPSQLNHMRESRVDMGWLKANVRPRFWRKFVTAVNAAKPPGVPDIEE